MLQEVGSMERLVSGLVLAVLVASPAPGWAQAETSVVTIVHGLPGFTADIYVDGELVLSGFKPKESTDPIEMPAGDYEVAIRDAGAPKNSEPALAATLTVPPGENLSVVAHLKEEGSPTVSVFDNDVSRIPAGKARLLVRHQAEAPPIDLQADGQALLTGVGSGEQAGQALSAATHELAVVGAQGGDSLVSPTSVDLEEGSAYFLYLIGSTEGQTLDLMVQRLGGLQSAPSGVATGEAGLAAQDDFPGWALFLMAVAGVVFVVSVANRRGRARRT
jgi:Domain of unknown function (DUF4397)